MNQVKPSVGTITTKNHHGVTVHSYNSPEEGLFVASHIVETEQGLVVFDAVFHLKHAEALAEWIAGLGKPIERIVLSHIHPDHWSGLSVLHARFPDTPIYAFPEITEYIKKNGQVILDARNEAFGPVVAKSPTLPDHSLKEGSETIGGVRFEFERQPDGESDWQTIVRLPDAKVMMVFDLVFPEKTHLFTVADHFDHWIAILQNIKAVASTNGYDTLLIGHGKPVGPDVIDGNISYLRKAKDIHSESKTAESFAETLKAAYPDYYGGGWVVFSSLLLYGIINP